MNERIEKLYARSFTDEQGECFDPEKFAKLIVRECASRVDNILRERKDGGGTMGDDIREYFGIFTSENIHSDKDYTVGTLEAQAEFEKKRNYPLGNNND